MIGISPVQRPLLYVVQVVIYHDVDHVQHAFPLLLGVKVKADGPERRHDYPDEEREDVEDEGEALAVRTHWGLHTPQYFGDQGPLAGLLQSRLEMIKKIGHNIRKNLKTKFYFNKHTG